MSDVSRRAALAAGLAAGVTTPLSTTAEAAAWPGPDATADDYPQFMADSGHSGWARTETTVTVATVGSLGQLWQRPVAESGWAPATGDPTVVGNGVFLGGRTVVRYDAQTGTRVWSRSIGAVVPTTPVYAHGLVVATGLDGSDSHLGAIDARTGALVWKRRLARSGFASPSIAGSTVLVGSEDRVQAFDLRTGGRRWGWVDPEYWAGMFGSPSAAGGLVIAGNEGNSRVTALNLSDGKVAWQNRLPGTNGWTMDGFGIAVDRASGRAFVGSTGDGSYSGAVRAVSVADGTTLWQTELGKSVWRAVAWSGSTVLANAETDLVALDAATGVIRWRFTKEAWLSPGMVCGGGVVLIGVPAGAVLDTPALLGFSIGSGRRLLTLALPGGAGYEPMGAAISRGRVFLPQWNRLLCLGPGGGPVGRDRSTPPPRRRSPVAPVHRQETRR